MKKFYYIVGAAVTAAAIFAFIAVMLKKLRISLCIEGIDDEIAEDTDDEITLSFDEDDDVFDCDIETETVVSAEDEE